MGHTNHKWLVYTVDIMANTINNICEHGKGALSLWHCTAVGRVKAALELPLRT
jgi:hypothetical protein